MARIGLAVYFFRLNDGTHQYILDDLGTCGTFVDCAYRHFKRQFMSYENVEERETVFKMTLLDKGQVTVDRQILFHYFHGIMKSGSYGIQSEIVDSETSQTAFEKKEKHAEVMPFHFSIYISPGDETGALVVQSIGNFGITTILKEELTKLTRAEINIDAKAIFVNVAAKQYLQWLFNHEQIKEMSLVRYAPRHGDPADRLKYGRFEYDVLEEVYKNPTILNEDAAKYVDCFANRNDFNEVLGIEGQEYDNIKFTFKVGKSTKTVQYKNFNSLIISEDVTDDVAPNGGHPEYVIIKPVMIELGRFYLQTAGIIARVDDSDRIENISTELEREQAPEEIGVG